MKHFLGKGVCSNNSMIRAITGISFYILAIASVPCRLSPQKPGVASTSYPLAIHGLYIASFPGLPGFFCSSVCVDNNTWMRKGFRIRVLLSKQTEEQG